MRDLDPVNSLNSFYVSVNADIPPFYCSVLPAFLAAPEILPIIEPYHISTKLSALQTFKASVPDNIAPRVLKHFAYKFAEPAIDNDRLCK